MTRLTTRVRTIGDRHEVFHGDRFLGSVRARVGGIWTAHPFGIRTSTQHHTLEDALDWVTYAGDA